MSKAENKIFACIIACIPFLYQYASPISILSLGDLALLIVVFGLGVRLVVNNKFRFDKNVGMLSIIIVTLTLLSVFADYYVLYDSFTLFCKVILYLFAISLLRNFSGFEYLIKIYVFLVFAFSLYLMIQFVTYQFKGIYLPIYLKHDWLFSAEMRHEDISIIYEKFYYAYRPSSLFLEPGYYALYTIPCLIYLLFYKTKHRILFAIWLSLTLFISQSGAAVAICSILWFLFFTHKFLYVRSGRIRITVNGYFILLIIVSILGLFIMTKFGLLNRVFGGSFGVRISRGFIIFDKLPFEKKLFGVGMNNISNYVKKYSIFTNFDEENLNGGSTFSTYLIQYGIVGYLSLIGFCIILFKKYTKDWYSFVSILVFVLYMVFEDVMFIYRMLFLVSFFISYSTYYSSETENELLDNDPSCYQSLIFS